MLPSHIALCITDLEMGGAERCLAQLAARLDRAQFEPVVYCLGPEPASLKSSCLDPLHAAGIPVHCLGGRYGWQLPWIVGKLARLLRKQRPALIQTMLFHANVVGAMAGRIAGVSRVVWGIRVAERAAGWHRAWSRRLGRLADGYVCVSRDVADFAQSEMGLAPDKISVIANGVDVDRFAAVEPVDLASLGIAPGRRLATFVGRLERQKGIGWLIESSPEWMAQVPDCDLLVVGSGPLARELAGQVEKLGIGDRVHFAGWRPDVPEILSASSVLVLPSQWEGMPNVVLEAMASRLPVVATNVEGVCELLGPQAGQQTVSYGDGSALADRLVGVLSDPARAAALGEANHLRAEQDFSLDAMVEAYERLWKTLLV